MKTGIIGLPQVGKTSLFKILTKAHLTLRGHSNARESHMGIARVPDERLDKLSTLYTPRKLVHATVEYVDVAAIGQEALKETVYATHLRNVDALAHVVRAFDDPTVAHVGDIDPNRPGRRSAVCQGRTTTKVSGYHARCAAYSLGPQDSEDLRGLALCGILNVL
jgi:ribosome-binding ATPase